MAGHYDLTVARGSVLRRTFAYKDANRQPVDLSGWEVSLQYGRGVPRTVLASTTDGGITVGADGVISVRVGATATGTLRANYSAPYELVLTPPNDPEGRYVLLSGTLHTE